MAEDGTNMKPQRGFTLTELMVTLAVAGVLAGVAVPNLRSFIQNSRLSSASNDLLRSFNLARTEAIKRQANVVVCASALPMAAIPACSYGPFNGWIVFQDNNLSWQWENGEPIFERHELLDPSVTVNKDNNGIEMYLATGFASPAGIKTPTRNIVLCDSRGNQMVGTNSVERAVLIAASGRTRVSATSADVSTAAAAAGACP
ncbi:MAG: prepilin-type N-terminal cleavage/methylation domain-containing protein [Gammaproteobacteria bacterium]|nr:MAG: prepilin-type N-terminal cleavage/methylation domain-containing protein [Gammaproteobacteria bacterium]